MCHACLCFDFPRSAVVVYCHALFSHSLFLCFILFSFFFYISLPLFRLNIPSRKLYLEKGRKRKEGKNCIALSVEKMRGINFCIYCIVRSIIGIRRIFFHFNSNDACVNRVDSKKKNNIRKHIII